MIDDFILVRDGKLNTVLPTSVCLCTEITTKVSMGAQPDSESKASAVMNTSITILCVSTVAVVLRSISRKLAKAGFWYDDYAIIVSLALATPLPTLLLTGMLLLTPDKKF